MRHRRWHVLERMVKEHDWRYGVELGVFEGETFRHLLKACPNLVLLGVDLFDSRHFASLRKGRPPKRFDLESSEQALARWLRENDLERRGFLLKSDTQEAAIGIMDGGLDFVFIDADHSYEAACADIDTWQPKVREGGMLVGHDYNKREFPGVVQAVDERFGGRVLLYDDHVWAVRC